MVMQEISPQYMAGLLDGDGTITITMHRRQSTKAGITLHPITKIDSVNLDFLELFQKQFGGHINKKRHERGWNKRPLWEWRLSSIESCLRFILPVKPFLILKKRQAELQEKFLKIREERYGCPYIKEEFNLWLEMREVNLRARGYLHHKNRKEKDALPP